jgi:transcriptional regulator with XRE-family HTH domain
MRQRLSSGAGLAVRKLRLAKGLTLAELSERSGVPLSSLSKLELGQVLLTYDKLMRLCRALEVDLEHVIRHHAEGSTAPSGRRVVARAGEGETARLGPHTAILAAPDLMAKPFAPAILTLNARSLAEHGPMIRLSGEVYLLTLEGAAVLHAESYAPLVLNVGDGVYFDGRSPHALLAQGKSAKVLLVAPPGDPALGVEP